MTCEKEDFLRQQIDYWDNQAKASIRAADYANNQLRIHMEALAELGGLALGDPDSPTRPVLKLIKGGIEDVER